MKPILRLLAALRHWFLDELERARSDDGVDEVNRSLSLLRRLRRRGGNPREEELLVDRLVAEGGVDSASPSARETDPPPRRLSPEEVRRRQSIFQNRARAMDEQLAADAGNLDALFAKAAFLALRQEYDEAARLLNDLTRLDPTYPGAWHLKAKVYQLMGDPRMAELCLRSAQRAG